MTHPTNLILRVMKSLSSLAVTIFTFAGLLMASAACFAQPAISLSPTGGPPGTTVSVAGRGFTPYAQVNIYFDTKKEGLAVANESGSFSKINLVVPAKTQPGTHWVSAVQRAGRIGAQAQFFVHTDWSQYGFDANHDHSNPYENELSAKTVGELVTQWTYPFAGPPSLVERTLYFASGNDVYAIDADSGQLAWQYMTKGFINATPAVSNGIVYSGAGDFNVYALNAKTGTLLWTYATGSYIVSSLVVSDGFVYAASDDNNIYALNASTGALLWEYSTGGPIQFAPSVDAGMVYVASSDGNIYALDAASGTLVWQFMTSPQYNGSTPTVVDGVLYMASADDNLYALNSSNGNLLWKILLGGAPADGCDAAVANGTVYLGSGDSGVFYAIDAVSGKVRWTYATNVPVYAASAVANGVVYFGSGDQNFYALNANSGKFLWRYATGTYFPSGIVANGTVYLAGSILYALDLPENKAPQSDAGSKAPELTALGRQIK
jgi:outer membrane protein assembly factor BamB